MNRKRPASIRELGRNECTIGQAAKILDVSTRTLVRWDQSGKFKALRTKTNRRYYTKEQVLLFAQYNKP